MQKKTFSVPKEITLFWPPVRNGPQKGQKMAHKKARNDPDMLKIAKIFDFYHEMLILELVYRGSTKDLIRIVLSKRG